MKICLSFIIFFQIVALFSIKVYCDMIEPFRESQSLAVDDRYVWVTAGFSAPHCINKSFLLRYDKKKDKWEIIKQMRNPILSIAIYNGEVWLGSYGGGVIKYDGTHWKNYTDKDGLGNNYISSIAFIKNFVWFGTNNGITRFNRKTGEWKVYTTKNSELPTNCFNIITTDGRGLWIASSNYYMVWYEEYPGADEKGGIIFYNTEKDIWNTYTGKRRRFEYTKNSKGTPSYKTFWLKGNSPLPSCDINEITANMTEVWFGIRNHGLGKYEPEDKQWTFYTADKRVYEDGYKTIKGNSELLSNDIRDIELQDNYIWIGTDKGLCKFNTNSNKWEIIKGLPVGSYINTISIDRESVWIKSYNPNFNQTRPMDKMSIDNLKENKLVGSIWIKEDSIFIGYSETVSVFSNNKWQHWQLTDILLEEVTK